MYLYRPKSTSLEVEIERSIYQNESVSSTSFNIKKKVEEKKKTCIHIQEEVASAATPP